MSCSPQSHCSYCQFAAEICQVPTTSFFTIKAARCHRCCWLHSCSNSVTRRPRWGNLQEQKVSLFTIDARLNSAATAIQAAFLSRVVTLSVFSFSIMSTRNITRSVSSCRLLALALAAHLLWPSAIALCSIHNDTINLAFAQKQRSLSQDTKRKS